MLTPKQLGQAPFESRPYPPARQAMIEADIEWANYERRIAELETENAALREAIAAENEACAVIAKDYPSLLSDKHEIFLQENHGKLIADAIRARTKK